VTILRDEIDSNLATARTDLQSNVTILRGEIDSNLATARTDLQSNVTILRGEIDSNLATARTDLQSNVTILRGEIDSNLATARTDLQSNVTILRDTAITFMGTKTFQDDVVLESNLRVQGDLLVANTVNMTVSDPILELGSNNQNTGDVGLVMTRHGASNSNVAIFFDETADTLKLGYTLNGAGDSTLEFDSNALAVSVQGALAATSVSGNGSGLTSLNATNISSGTINKDRLPTTLNNTTIESAGHGTLTISDSSGDNQSITKYTTTSFNWTTGIHGQGGSGGEYKIANGGDLATNTRVTIDTAGQVGIATDSPAYTLDVHGTSNVGALTATSVSGNGSGLTSLNASNISSGTINKDRLPGTLNDTTFGSITLTSSTCLYVDGDYLAYNPVEGGSSISRNFVKFIKTDNASYPFYTNRTPSGDVVIGSGTTAAGGEIERMRFKGGDGTRDIEVSNANLVVSGNITGGTIDAAKISNGTLADSTGGVKAIYFTNTEQSGYYTDKSGILAFDQNFYDDTEYGTGTYDPDATFVGGNGGGLLIKNEDGWGAIFTSQNTRWAKGYWDTLNVTNTVTASTFSGSGSGLTSLNASNLTSGTVSSDRLSLAASDIPDLSASKITTGTLTRPIDTTTGTFSGRVDSDRYLTSNTFPLPDPNQHSFRHVCMITNSSVPYGLTQAGGCIYEYNPSTGDTVRVVEPVSEPTAGTFNATGGREYFPMGSPMTIVNTQKMVPFTNLGSLFGFIESRYDASTAYLYAPYSNVTVEYFHDTSVTGTPTSTIVVPSKTVTTFTCTTAGGTNSHIFVAKGGKILMSSTGNGGDTRVLAPLSTIAYGYNNTNFANDIYRENNVTTSGKCVYSNQNVPLILSQAGDGDGGDGTCGIPFELVADTYIVPHDIRGWMIQFLYTETVVNVAYWSATNSQWEQYGTYSPSGTPSILSPEQLQVGKMSLTGTDIGTSHTLWMFTGTKDFTLTVEEYTDLERTVSGFRAHQVAQQIQTNLLDNVVQDSNGNVGIGTENPGQALHIYRSGANNAVIKAEAAGTQEAEIQLYHTGDAAAWSMYMPANSDSLRFYRNGDKMTLTSGGNVGIGTVSPVAKLQVAGQTVISENITTQNGTTVYNADLSVVSEIGYTASGTADIDIGATSSTIGGYTSVYRYKLYTDVASGNSKFKIASVAGPSGTYNGYGTVTDRITLDNNGNVGIGTTSPGAKLHLVVPDIGNTTEVLRLQNGNGTGDIVSTSGGFIGMHLRDNNVGGGEVARISWKHDGGDGTAEGLGQLGFWTSNTGSAEGVPEERMTILADGNVGIGTASPQDTLHVYGAPFIQHDTRRNLGAAAWYKIGTWDAADSDGARLKISLLGANGYDGASRSRGGETIIYASINNNLNTSVANIDGLVETHGKPVTTSVKFKQVGTDRTKYEIHAYIASYTQHSMSVECSQTTTFTKEWVASSDPGNESSTVSHAIFSTVVDNSGNVGIGTTNPVAKLDVIGNIYTSSTYIRNVFYAPANWGYSSTSTTGETLWSFTFNAPVNGYIITALNGHWQNSTNGSWFFGAVTVDDKEYSDSSLFDAFTGGGSDVNGGNFHEYRNSGTTWQDLNHTACYYVSSGNRTIGLYVRVSGGTLNVNGAAISLLFIPKNYM
jgi:hypothetical protein